MKLTALPAYVWLVLAVLIVGGIIWTGREGFIPSFDRTQENRTIATENSSYAQQTNHFTPAPAELPPIPGIPGKDQVNMFQAYVT